MAFMQLKGANDLREPELAPEGDYSLVVTDVDPYTKDNGREIVKLRIDFQDHDEYQSFLHWIALPSWKLDVDGCKDGPKKGQENYNFMSLGIKRICAQWNVPFDDGFEPADYMGADCIAAVTQEERNDKPGEFNNRLMTPRLS